MAQTTQVSQTRTAVPTARPQTRPAADGLDVSRAGKAVVDEVAKVIVGKKRVLEDVLMSILADGHVLFEDFPGLAKTLTANTFAQASGCIFKRIQFTPDLLPSDITGSYVYDKEKGTFVFHPGPIFTNILLADEINRAPPKVQSALLEAMQEKQVTIEGVTHKLPRPFIVLATQNPIEQEGTYPLPEAQLDRFLMRISVGYPSRTEEAEVVNRRLARGKDEADVLKVIDPERILSAQRSLEGVRVEPAIVQYAVELVARTREDERVQVGSSPRGSLALIKLARAHAALRGRGFVTPDDVKAIASQVLNHRLILRPEPRIKGVTGHDVIQGLLGSTKAPVT